METNTPKKLSPEDVSEILRREEEALAEKKKQAELTLPIHERMSISEEGITFYPLDYDKVTRLEDVMTVLQSLDIRFSQDHASFDKVKHLLKGV